MSLLELFEYTLKFNLPVPNTANWFYVMVIVLFVVLDLAGAGGNPARSVHRLVFLKSSSSQKLYL